MHQRDDSFRSTPGGWSRAWQRTASVAAVLALASAYLLALQGPSVGMFHDDGIYAVTARALAEDQGYRILSLPGSPPQTKYPILFPWLLSLVWRIAPEFPHNVPWLRAVPLLATVTWLGLSWRLLQSCGAGRTTATIVVLLTAVSPWTLFFGTALLTETLFAALVTAMLLALQGARTTASPPDPRRAALAGLFAGAGLLTRAAGIAPAGAGLAWLLWRRRWKEAFAFTVAVTAVFAPWGVWVLAQRQAVVEAYHSASIYGAWNIVFAYTWPQKLDVLTGNLLYSALTPVTFWGFPSNPLVLVVSSVAVGAIAIRGLWLTRHHVVTWCVAAVGAMNLLWVWPPPRFFFPVFPLLLWQASEALRPLPRTVVSGLTTMLTVVSAVGFVQAVEKTLAAEEWRRLAPLLEWVKRETPPTAVVAGIFDPAYFLVADRTALRPFIADPYKLAYAPSGADHDALGTVEEFRQHVLASRIDYCIWSPAKGLIEAPHYRGLLDGLAKAYPGGLKVVAGREDSGYAVYFVDRARLAAVEHPRTD